MTNNEEVLSDLELELYHVKCENARLRMLIKDSNVFLATLALIDAYKQAKSNEECAEILRLYCTDGKAFIDKFMKGL